MTKRTFSDSVPMQCTQVRAVAVIQPPSRAKACALRYMGRVSRVKSGGKLHAGAYCHRISLVRMQPLSREGRGEWS